MESNVTAINANNKSVKLGMLVNPEFQRVLKEIVISAKPVKAKAAYAISKILSKVQKENDRYQEARTTLINKYCKKDEAGNLIVDDEKNAAFLSDEAQQEFAKEIIELQQVDVAVSTINLNDIEAYEIKPMDMMQIQDIITES